MSSLMLDFAFAVKGFIVRGLQYVCMTLDYPQAPKVYGDFGSYLI